MVAVFPRLVTTGVRSISGGLIRKMRNAGCRTAVLVALVSLSLAMVACSTTTTIDSSRHTLYSDVSVLSGDSEAIVDVVVKSQEVVQEEIPYTLSTVTVIAPLRPKGLASNREAAAEVTPEEQIVIRQMGSVDEEEVPAPLLEVGHRYLLFITSTKLEGDAASQFYVTGVSAGIYRTESSAGARGGDVTYTHVDRDSGDDLPPTLTAADLAG
ncbi:hypothetical protein [Microbacterium oxydans]|uniref:hypothetical protein n=1 Tax=Microbacterium oxydans TaxID=82380 RepID=UPI0036717498